MSVKKNTKFNTITLFAVSIAVYAILLVLMLVGVIDEYNAQILTFAGIYIIIALSLNLITGFTGQLALGHAGFMAIGAYTSSTMLMKLNMPLLPSILFAGVVTAVFGFLIGFPTLRLRGDYLAITTLGFGEVIRSIMVNLESITGGAAGLKGIPSFTDTSDFLLGSIIKFSWVFVFVIATIAVVSNLMNSSPGRAIISIREDEIASNSMGINVAYYKMFSFTMSAFLAGIGGGLYAIYMGYLNPDMFKFLKSVDFVVIVVLGGLGSITGTILGGIIITFMQEWLWWLQDYRLVIYGLMLVLMMLFRPKGLMGTTELSIVKTVRKFIFKQDVSITKSSSTNKRGVK